MDDQQARSLIENLLDRLLVKDARYELPSGIITSRERTALALLAGISLSEDKIPPKFSDSPTLISSSIKLNDSCLDLKRDASAMLCVDFGTAYSKAAIWKKGAKEPIPIDLVPDEAQGLLADSAAYVEEGHIFFGREAVRRFTRAGDPTRKLFESPKEYLTHDHENFETAALPTGIDPTGQFNGRDLLALYLGYLTSLASAGAEKLGFGRHIQRRFAAPGWGDTQISQTSPHFLAVSESLKGLLIDAQILADSVNQSIWKTGLDAGTARAMLDQLRHVSAGRRQGAKFVERPVLEAVAAASGVQDGIKNTRPQILVVDVGAGTTDIGVFKYVVRDEGARVAAYKNGLKAIRRAGNFLDDALVRLAWQKVGMPDDSQHKPIFERKMRAIVRDSKSDLFSAGATTIAVDGFDMSSIEMPEFLATPLVKKFRQQFDDGVVELLNGAGIGAANFCQIGQPNIAVLTGGGAALPFLREALSKPIQLEGGVAHFEVRDSRPSWVEEMGGDVAQVFPQLAVATGGCAPYLPDEIAEVMDTTLAASRSMAPNYRS